MIENINNLPRLKYFRKKLRNHPTKAEIYLWNFLRKSQVNNVKFRRQQSIGPYIVDFYTYQYNLAIELDGEIHGDPMMIEHDMRRDKYLKEKKVRVIRFENSEVFEDIEKVLERITNSFTTPDPS
jgi:very-short-patch-repair endonuclease